MSSSPAPKRHRVVDFLVERWVALVLIVLAVVFIAQNRERVSVTVLWTDVTAPMWLFLAILFVAGFAAGSIVYRRRARSQPR